MSDPGEEKLSRREEQLTKALLHKQWLLDRYLLEWKALYAGAGMGDVSDRQAYLDAQSVVSSEGPQRLIPGGDAEVYGRAGIFLHAFDRMKAALELLDTEVSLERGPEVWTRMLERIRGIEEEGEDEPA